MRSTCCIAFLVLAACASSPVTLVALPPAPHVAAQHGGGPNSGTTMLLRPLVMPGYLDAYPVVTGHNGSTLIVSSKTEWAEPLSDAAARVLRDALSQRLGASRVLIAGEGRIPDADLTVETSRSIPSRERYGSMRSGVSLAHRGSGPVMAAAVSSKSRSKPRQRLPLLPLLRMPGGAWPTCSRRRPNARVAIWRNNQTAALNWENLRSTHHRIHAAA